MRGLTLIELVLTLGLLGILGIPSGIILSEHLLGALSSQDTHRALQLARSEMEQLDAFNNFFAPALALGTTVIPNYSGAPYTLTRVVSCEAGNCSNTALASQGIKRIRVTVAPISDPSRILAQMISYRTKHVQFGS